MFANRGFGIGPRRALLASVTILQMSSMHAKLTVMETAVNKLHVVTHVKLVRDANSTGSVPDTLLLDSCNPLLQTHTHTLLHHTANRQHAENTNCTYDTVVLVTSQRTPCQVDVHGSPTVQFV